MADATRPGRLNRSFLRCCRQRGAASAGAVRAAVVGRCFRVGVAHQPLQLHQALVQAAVDGHQLGMGAALGDAAVAYLLT